MRAEFAYEEAQKYLRQRNQLALVAGVLAVTTLLGVGAAVRGGKGDLQEARLPTPFQR